MTDPYIKAEPGDPILSEHWNTVQVRTIEALRTHTHLGGDDGKKLGGGSIDPETTLSVKQVNVSTTLAASQLTVSSALTVKGINVADRLTGLGTEKLNVTGGTVSGALSVTGNVGVGTATPNKQLTVNYTRGDNHAPMEVRGPGNAVWGVGLVVRTTGSVDGAAILLRSREKSWQLRGESGATATGFQITENGGDIEYGQGYGTPRLHISAGGNVGIGTTSPQSMLHIVSTTSVLARIEAGGAGGWAELDLYSTFGTANQRNWNLAAQGGGGFAIRMLSDARGWVMTPLHIDTGGTVFATRNLQVQGDLYAANSAMYFTKTDHEHSGIGNTQGYAAIENASNYGALMILGRTTPSGRIVKLWDRLEVIGKTYSSGGYEGSDLRLKRDITPMEGALEKVLKLRATCFRMVESRDESPQIGLIAQEVEEVFPEVIDEGPGGMKGINYARLVAPLIEAIKAQQHQLDALRAALRAATKENPA
ncbi:tail fiber domain-containing protein [Pyxidicoccus sp. MSG2]|uniref:tail fiber domain-containing protein n=1 Tax=Pyxidicoccus sp. MSG2 TaxID=2996790 RepID=UPI00226D6746|nr:tail fiber domain-containing protein [Pyxidicoccus sp. MSG2]MCY1020992.1 tail fiber domain-containing protein [Pyxidicoccus sp. MSG2]